MDVQWPRFKLVMLGTTDAGHLCRDDDEHLSETKMVLFSKHMFVCFVYLTIQNTGDAVYLMEYTLQPVLGLFLGQECHKFLERVS